MFTHFAFLWLQKSPSCPLCDEVGKRISAWRRYVSFSWFPCTHANAAFCKQREEFFNRLSKRRLADLHLQYLEVVGTLGPPCQAQHMQLKRFQTGTSNPIVHWQRNPGEYIHSASVIRDVLKGIVLSPTIQWRETSSTARHILLALRRSFAEPTVSALLQLYKT